MTAGVNRGALALVLALTTCQNPREGMMAAADGAVGATDGAPASGGSGPGDLGSGGGGSGGPNNPPPVDASSSPPSSPDGGLPARADAISPPPLPPAPAGHQRVNLVVQGPGRVSQVGGSFQCMGACVLTADVGSRVTLKAEPEVSAIPDAVSFLGWSGECTGRGECTLVLDRDRPLVATFRRFLVWEQQVPATAIAADGAGLYTWGTFGSTGRIGGQVLGGRGGSEGVLARFDHAGALQWFRVIGSADQDRSIALGLSSMQTLFVFGETGGSEPRFETMPLWGPGDSDRLFLSTVSADGRLVRTRAARAWGGVASGPDGSVVVTEDNVRGRLVKLDARGETVWAKQGLSPNWAFHKMPAVDAKGNVAALHPLNEPVTVGGITYTRQSMSDNLLLSYTSTGELRWAVQLGMELSVGVTAMEFDTEGDLHLLIAFNGQLRVGGRVRNSVDGSQDIAVAKLSGTDGSPSWLLSWGSSLIDTPGGFAVQPGRLLTATFQAPIQVASTRLEAGPAIISLDYTGLESTVANVGREFVQLRAVSQSLLYLTKDGRVGRLSPW